MCLTLVSNWDADEVPDSAGDILNPTDRSGAKQHENKWSGRIEIPGCSHPQGHRQHGVHFQGNLLAISTGPQQAADPGAADRQLQRPFASTSENDSSPSRNKSRRLLRRHLLRLPLSPFTIYSSFS